MTFFNKIKNPNIPLGSILKKFPPSKTISPSVRLLEVDRSHDIRIPQTNFNIRIKAMNENNDIQVPDVDPEIPVVETCDWEPLGTLEQPYHIKNITDLQNISNDLSGHYVLCNDIDASDTSSWNDGAGFTPIGTFSAKFTGSLDGQGYEIDSLFMRKNDLCGLFGWVSNCTIKNLSIVNATIEASDRSGGFAGATEGNTQIINCHFQGNLSDIDPSISSWAGFAKGFIIGETYYNTSSNNFNSTLIEDCTASGNIQLIEKGSSAFVAVGGIAGNICNAYNSDLKPMIKNCIVNATIDITHSVSERSLSGIGGISGQTINTIIENCTFRGVANGCISLGGIAGWAAKCNISKCSNYGNISISSSPHGGTIYGQDIGGIIGNSRSSNIINKCVNYGNIITHDECYAVGGLIGYSNNAADPAFGNSLDDLRCYISDCFSSGEVTGAEMIGGFIGNARACMMTRCYASGNVTGLDDIGGLIGWYSDSTATIYSQGEITYSYWDTETTNQIESHGSDPIFGKTTSQMKQQSTYETWDFTDIWEIEESVTYPSLQDVPYISI